MGPADRGTARLYVEVAGEQRLVTVEPVHGDGSRFRLSWDDTSCEVDVARLHSGALSLIVPSAGHASHEVTCDEMAPGDLALGVAGRRVRARVTDGRRPRAMATAQADGDHAVVAPMPGRLVRMLVAPGDTVDAGQGLAVVEAMKMENVVASPVDGVVAEARAAAGDSVESGAVLVVVRREGQD